MYIGVLLTESSMQRVIGGIGCIMMLPHTMPAADLLHYNTAPLALVQSLLFLTG